MFSASNSKRESFSVWFRCRFKRPRQAGVLLSPAIETKKLHQEVLPRFVEQHSPGKYQENGHDTFSDFVTLVCQEAQNTQPQTWKASTVTKANDSGRLQWREGKASVPTGTVSVTSGGSGSGRSQSSHKYYNTTMLPPPPPPPMARPVAIIRSTADVTCGADASPPSAHSVSPHAVSVVMETDAAGNPERMTSPPVSSAGQADSPEPGRRASPVITLVQHTASGQLYTYASIAGSVSPTSMALYTSPPRSTSSSVVRMSASASSGSGSGSGGSGGSGSRWSQHFILEENVDYGMMQSLLPAAAGAEVPAGIIDDDRYFSSVVHTGADALEPAASSAPATVVVPSPSSQPPGSPAAKSQP